MGQKNYDQPVEEEYYREQLLQASETAAQEKLPNAGRQDPSAYYSDQFDIINRELQNQSQQLDQPNDSYTIPQDD